MKFSQIQKNVFILINNITAIEYKYSEISDYTPEGRPKNFISKYEIHKLLVHMGDREDSCWVVKDEYVTNFLQDIGLSKLDLNVKPGGFS